ncbi:hypothetical protein GCM10017744_078410 [Streptomyces antimycoticus]|uniref:Uncharacterized protein n=1 Tax=Streptomyces antimycoticus TaxID=68175 RepID=A0A4D4K534_9ACTN|nr:hypothetical protein SANT12839_023010 [Streptomyces antimycoticus]
MTSGDWSGDADGLVFQNTGSRAVYVEYTTYTNDGTVPVDGTVYVTTSKASRRVLLQPDHRAHGHLARRQHGLT